MQEPPSSADGRAPQDSATLASTPDGPPPTVALKVTEASGELGQFGKYRVLKLIGKGGMGEVFLAFDPVLKRRVALKVMLVTHAVESVARARFLREAQAVAGLQHDHIIPVYEVQEQDGSPFLVMPFLLGETLQARLAREPILPTSLALRLGREMAAGLAAAHRAGILHRDIKPSNIFLEQLPDAGADAVRVKIFDFGLARSVDGGEAVTKDGAIVGTPAYMSPEQSRGDPVDERADLFSLGCVLYEMVAGRRAFAGRDIMAVLSAIALHTPERPDRVNPKVPEALADLIGRLLRKDPRERTASAAETLEGLKRVQDSSSDTVTLASPIEQSGERRIKSARSLLRSPMTAAVAALLLLVGTFVAWRTLRQTEHGNPTPPVVAPGEPGLPPFIAESERFEWQPKELVAVIGEHRQRHWGPVTGMTLQNQLATCAWGDSFVRLWDPATLDLKETLPLPHPNAVCIAGSPYGRWLACGLETGNIVVWDRSKPNDPPRQVLTPSATACTSLDFSSNESALFASDLEGGLMRIDMDADKLKPIPFPQKIKTPITCLAVSPDGAHLVAGDSKGGLELWVITKPNPALTRSWKGHSSDVRAVAFSKNARCFWTGGEDGHLLRWTTSGKKDEKPQSLPCPTNREGRFPNTILSLALSVNGEYLVASDGWHFYVWHVTDDVPRTLGRESHEANGQARAILSLDGSSVFTSDGFGRVRKRNRKSDEYPVADSVLPQAANSFAVSAATGDIAAVWGDRALRLWRTEAKGPRLLWTSPSFTDLPYGVSFNAAGLLLLSAEDNTNGPRLWAVEGEKVRSMAIGETRSNFGNALSPKGDLIAAATDEPGFVWLGWDGAKMTFLEAKKGDPDTRAHSFSFSASGQTLAIGGLDGHVHVWEVKNAKLRQIKHFTTDTTMQSIALHPEGSLLIAASRWGGANLFDVRDDKPVGVKLSAADAQCVCFDRTGDLCAGGMLDGTLIVWETKTRKEAHGWKLPGRIIQVAFSPDSSLLYSLNGNGTIYALRLK